MNTQFKKGVLEMCVIAALYEHDCYGYELVSKISTCVSISEGTIYPLLKRLSDDNLVSTYLKESQTGAPRKYYKLNQAGKEIGKGLVSEWLSFVTNVNELLQPIQKNLEEEK